MTSPAPMPETIEKLASAVFPSFAMLAGMQLDLFTPLKDGPMSAEQLAKTLGVRPDKLNPLLYALVAAGLLTVKDDRFSNTPEAHHFLVRGRPSYKAGCTSVSCLGGSERSKLRRRFELDHLRQRSISRPCQKTNWNHSIAAGTQKQWQQDGTWRHGTTSHPTAV